MSIDDVVNRFLQESAQFQLGSLPTEQPHPLTLDLSEKAQSDLLSAIETFKEVEILAFEKMLDQIPALEKMKADMKHCLDEGHRVFFCGCGSTGRLSVAIESLWRESTQPEYKERVQGFIAGGDYALVKSIENFEDHPEYGARQLMELGFSKDDLLISCTEGGETPFVIGATLKAAQISRRSSYFLFCNPVSSLKNILRSQAIFKHDKIISISLPIGNMAICGSTRLQASSVLYMACAFPLLSFLDSQIDIEKELRSYIQFLMKSDLQSLKALIELEAQTYRQFNHLTYHARTNALGVLTDMTERSPTFSLRAVENKLDPNVRPATVNLCIDSANSSAEAWKQIIGRAPINLAWPELQGKYADSVVLGFDFSQEGLAHRQQLIGESTSHQHVFIQELLQSFKFKADHFEIEFERPENSVQKQLFLKLLFNITSSLAMCLNHRVLGNIMLYVRPSNKKLIDRAARYVQEILKEQHGKIVSYRDVIVSIYLLKGDDSGDEPVVPKAVKYLI